MRIKIVCLMGLLLAAVSLHTPAQNKKAKYEKAGEVKADKQAAETLQKRGVLKGTITLPQSLPSELQGKFGCSAVKVAVGKYVKPQSGSGISISKFEPCAHLK